MPTHDCANWWNGVNGVFYYSDPETGETKPINIGMPTFADIKEPTSDDEYYEDSKNIIATIPSNMEFTFEVKQTHKQARQTHKALHAIFNSYKRRIRLWYRTKERLRRANLKGKEYIRISPRIVDYLAYKGMK